jgi:hypothetical protein
MTNLRIIHRLSPSLAIEVLIYGDGRDVFLQPLKKFLQRRLTGAHANISLGAKTRHTHGQFRGAAELRSDQDGTYREPESAVIHFPYDLRGFFQMRKRTRHKATSEIYCALTFYRQRYLRLGRKQQTAASDQSNELTPFYVEHGDFLCARINPEKEDETAI